MTYDPEFYDIDYDNEMVEGTGYNADDGCYYYEGCPCPDADSFEEAEMEYWNTH
ncbi:MAG: hypothetical protein ACI4QD_00625 [Kiritimatiellia bacterium]